MTSLQISFGWSTVKIDMSTARRVQPLMPFSVPAFAATLFALGLALGTTIAVGMLFFIQVSLARCVSSGPLHRTTRWASQGELFNGLHPKLFKNIVNVMVSDLWI